MQEHLHLSPANIPRACMLQVVTHPDPLVQLELPVHVQDEIWREHHPPPPEASGMLPGPLSKGWPRNS